MNDWDDERPRTRGDCEGRPRPCPWVGCRHNLLIDVTPAGSIVLNAGRRTRLSLTPRNDGKVRRRTLNVTRRTGVLRPKAGPMRVQEFADLVVAELEAPGRASCVLDVAEENCIGMTLEATGDVLAITRERARQLEEDIMAKLRTSEEAAAM